MVTTFNFSHQNAACGIRNCFPASLWFYAQTCLEIKPFIQSFSNIHSRVVDNGKTTSVCRLRLMARDTPIICTSQKLPILYFWTWKRWTVRGTSSQLPELMTETAFNGGDETQPGLFNTQNCSGLIRFQQMSLVCPQRVWIPHHQHEARTVPRLTAKSIRDAPLNTNKDKSVTADKSRRSSRGATGLSSLLNRD